MSLSFLMPTKAMRVPGISCIGARMYLSKRLLVPDDPGRFVGLGVIESLEGAGLAAVDAVERGAEFDLGLGSDVVAGGAQTPEHLLARGRILRHRRSGRSRKRDGGNHPCPHDILLFSPVALLQSAPYQGGARLDDRKKTPPKRASRREPTCNCNRHAIPNGVTGLQCQRPKATMSPAAVTRAGLPRRARWSGGIAAIKAP